MRRIGPAAAILLFLGLLGAGSLFAQESPPGVAAELRRYYATGEPLPWSDACRRLAESESDEATAAAAYLIDLLEQAQRDRDSGTLPWRLVDCEVMRDNRAEELVGYIHQAATWQMPPERAVPVLRWYVMRGDRPNDQVDAAEVLRKVHSPEVDAFWLELAERPHPHESIAAAALQEVHARRLELSDARVAELLGHHRRTIRTAAGALAAQRGIRSSVPFDPDRALAMPPVRALVEHIRTRLLHVPLAGAPFVEIRTTSEGTMSGWLLETDPDHWQVITSEGERNHIERASGSLSVIPFQTVVDRVVRARAEERARWNVQADRPPRFRRHADPGPSIEAILVWMHAHAQGDDAAAARLLLPVLEDYPRDEDFLAATRDILAMAYGAAMFEAFVVRREYERALEIAKFLAEGFAGSPRHEDALALVRQIPQRLIDFQELRLPSPEQWAVLRRSLTRAQQIDFLCRRLRLLICFPEGIPGDTEWGMPQYIAAPSAGNRRGSIRDQSRRAINPYLELLGEVGDYGRTRVLESAPTPEDVGRMAAWLREDWFSHSHGRFSFHRGGAPPSTRCILSMILREATFTDLCDERALVSGSPEEVEKVISHVEAWARDHAGWTAVDILLHALERAESGEDVRPDPWRYLDCLVEWKVARALPLLLRKLERSSTRADLQVEILQACRVLDPRIALPAARRMLGSADGSVRVQAALVLAASGRVAEAHDALVVELREWSPRPPGANSLLAAVDWLRDEGTSEGLDAVAGLFSDLRLFHSYESWGVASVAKRLLALGRTEPIRLFRRLLDVEEPRVEDQEYPIPVATRVARLVAEDLAPRDSEPGRLAHRPNLSDDERARAVRAWLDERIRAAGAAEAND